MSGVEASQTALGRLSREFWGFRGFGLCIDGGGDLKLMRFVGVPYLLENRGEETNWRDKMVGVSVDLLVKSCRLLLTAEMS